MAHPPHEFESIAFIASSVPEARSALRRLAHRYGNAAPDQADAIVALGGDGLMLQTLHTHMHDRIPIYGMNRGSVGFLMNEYTEEDLIERLNGAHISRIHPLAMTAIDREGESHRRLAVNEVSLFRERYQAAKLAICVELEAADAGDDLRWCAGGDAGWIDRLQPVGTRPHSTDQRPAARTDADQSVPP